MRPKMWRAAVPIAALALLVGLVGLAIGWAMDSAAGSPLRGEPSVTRSYFAEKDTANNPTGKLCTQVVAQTRTDVALALSCSYPPAESRIADLLEGAGQ